MDYIKEAFQKVKQDMGLLKSEIDSLKSSFNEIQQELSKLNDSIKTNLINNTPRDIPTQETTLSTLSTLSSTHLLDIKGLKGQNKGISTGNEGVPTDRQTDRQTDRHIDLDGKNNQDSIEDVTGILNSLDNIKKEVRLKFKRLTEQEFLVFSTLYQLDEEKGFSDYKTLSDKLNLTESSIRDYIGRLIKKGINIEKTKINNKNIQLSIPQNLKKIATLSTILQLRDL